MRYAFIGHDLHGLRIGPDGKLYFSIGDRGLHVETAGRTLAVPDTGAVLRCNLDGSDLEIFATGLRNPQELAFDSHGNLFTGDNNSDGGDKARWVHVVEGGDSGWRIGYQYLEAPDARPLERRTTVAAPWPGQARYLDPAGRPHRQRPGGARLPPGDGRPRQLKDHFFLADFRGQASTSGVHAFAVRPRGAGFEIADRSRFAWGVLATDVDFGPDGALYLLDWVSGWTETGKGRIYRVTPGGGQRRAGGGDPGADRRQVEPKRAREAELATLLGHADIRVRLEAQVALVEKKAHAALQQVAAGRAGKVAPLARLHAVWALGQLIRPPGVDVVASDRRAGRRAGQRRWPTLRRDGARAGRSAGRRRPRGARPGRQGARRRPADRGSRCPGGAGRS